MFTKLLRLFLSLIFFGCVIWGAILIGAPTAVKFIVNKTFGDSVALYNLRITPKLNILVSRIEISDFKYQDKFIDGSIRSLETKMTGLFNLKPIVSVSTEQIRLDEVVTIDKVAANFSFPEISLNGKVNIELELKEVLSENSVYLEFLRASGAFDLRNGVLSKANVTGQNSTILKNLSFTAATITGSLSNWNFINDDLALPTGLNLEFHKIEFPNKNIVVKTAMLSSELVGGKYNVSLTSDDFMDISDNYLAHGVSLDLSTSSFTTGGIENMELHAKSLNLLPSRFVESGKVTDLSINLIKNNSLNFDLSVNGKLTDAKLITENFPVAQLSKSNFEINTKYIVSSDVSSKLEAVFKLIPEAEQSINVDVVAALDVSGNDIFYCILNNCVFSNFSLGYDLLAHQDKLAGILACPSLPCKNTAVEHEIKTNDTNAFFESAANSRIFNPIFLAFVYRTILEGEQVGDGHFVRF